MDYAENDVVLCYHGPLLYEAKILKTKRFDENSPTSQYGPHYFVHYKGWKNTWDEWVHQSRLLKRDETNLALQKTLQQTHRAALYKDKEPVSHKAKEKDPQKDRERDKVKETRFPRKETRLKQPKPKEEEYDEADYPLPVRRKQEPKFSIPEVLKVAMVDDWESVTRHGQLVALPRTPCVDDILLEFRDYLLLTTDLDVPSDVEETLPSVLIGFKQYFDVALGANLLYRFERAQYADALRRYVANPDLRPEQLKTLSQIYGAEHLVRLIVSLPAQMGATNMEPGAMDTIREYSALLLQFLAQDRDRFFLKEYEATSTQYLGITRA